MKNIIQKDGVDYGKGYFVECRRNEVDMQKEKLLQKLYDRDAERGRYYTEFEYKMEYYDDEYVRLEINFKVDKSKVLSDR